MYLLKYFLLVCPCSVCVCRVTSSAFIFAPNSGWEQESFGSVMIRALGFSGSCVCCGLGGAGASWGCVLAEIVLLCLIAALGKWEMSCTEIGVALECWLRSGQTTLASECWVLKPLLLETGFRKLCAFISLETLLWGGRPLTCAVCLWHTKCWQVSGLFDLASFHSYVSGRNIHCFRRKLSTSLF